jgi:hypothetical protein
MAQKVETLRVWSCVKSRWTVPKATPMTAVVTSPKTFNNRLGLERGLWQRKSGCFTHVPITSVFERLSSVKNAYWVLLYAAKRLTLWLSATTRIRHAAFTAASKI